MEEVLNLSYPRRTLIKLLPLSLFLIVVSISYADVPKYEKAGKRNPFIPYVTNDGHLTNIGSEKKELTLKLEGIIFDKDGNSMAIINGEILGKGDTIGDAKIIEIRKDSVVYIKNGEIFVIDARREE